MYGLRVTNESVKTYAHNPHVNQAVKSRRRMKSIFFLLYFITEPTPCCYLAVALEVACGTRVCAHRGSADFNLRCVLESISRLDTNNQTREYITTCDVGDGGGRPGC